MAMLAAYSALLANGQISEDPAQNAAVQALDKLATALLNARRKSFFRKADKVRGLYIWGDVGRGKSMLMDLFFQTTQTTPKRRVHFHAFMQEVHGFLAYWRGLSPPERRRSQWRVKGAGDDPIQPAAAKIAASARLICFDEFQVTQIADAMILSRLFEALFDRGVTVVSTSNRPPEDLYKHGINRQLFLPFIKLLEQECETLELVSARDYRLERLTEAPVWHTPIGPEANSHLDAAWTRLTLDAPAPSETLDVSGRALHVPRAAGGCCRFSFEDLCVNPLGPADTCHCDPVPYRFYRRHSDPGTGQTQ